MNDQQPQQRKGACLCGAVRFSARPEQNHIDACHCSMCRQWSGGGPYIGISCGTSVEFEDENSIGVYQSSDFAERGFCKNCGSALFYRMRESGRMTIPVGLLEETEGLDLTLQIFVDEKPDYYALAGEIKSMTGAEVIAAFESGEGAF